MVLFLFPCSSNLVISWVSVVNTLMCSRVSLQRRTYILLGILSTISFQVSASLGIALIIENYFVQGHNPSQEDPQVVTWPSWFISRQLWTILTPGFPMGQPNFVTETLLKCSLSLFSLLSFSSLSYMFSPKYFLINNKYVLSIKLCPWLCFQGNPPCDSKLYG